MQSTVPPVPVRERFLRLCRSDNRLRHSIKNIHINWRSSGLIAVIEPEDGQFKWISRRLYKIAAYLHSLGHFEAIQVNFANRVLTFLMADLLEACPAIERVKPPSDRQHEIEINHVQVKNFLESLLSYHERRCSLFVIGTDGIYKQVRIHKGTISKIRPERMIGQPIDRFVGINAGRYLRRKIEEAYRLNKPEQAEYQITYPDGETRTYAADVIPVPDTESAVVLVNRIR